MFIATYGEPEFLIRTSSDWDKLAEQQLDLIIDPMIYRTVEVFLGGPPPRGHDESKLSWTARLDAAWRPISQNLQELSAFLDLLVYVERLPMIDYIYTFPDSGQYPGTALYQTCNAACGRATLSSVKVAHDPYMEAREYAVEALRGSRFAPSDAAARHDVEDELSAFDHSWRPQLPEIDPAYVGNDDVPGRAVDTFLYGGALFGVYAKLASTAHVLQAKRAKMLGAAAVEGHRASEPDLFAAIDTFFQGRAGERFEVDALPSVLPWVLARGVGSPLELIQATAALRATTMAEEARQWRSQLIDDWRSGRGISKSARRDLRRLATRIRTAETEYKLPQPDVTSLAGAEPVLSIVGYAIRAIPWDRLRLWTLPNVPGKNHLKLLYRLHGAHGAYSAVPDYWRYVDQTLRRVWIAAAEPEFD